MERVWNKIVLDNESQILYRRTVLYKSYVDSRWTNRMNLIVNLCVHFTNGYIKSLPSYVHTVQPEWLLKARVSCPHFIYQGSKQDEVAYPLFCNFIFRLSRPVNESKLFIFHDPGLSKNILFGCMINWTVSDIEMLQEKQLRSLHTFRLRQESDDFDITSLYLLHHLVYCGYILCIWSAQMEFWK